MLSYKLPRQLTLLSITTALSLGLPILGSGAEDGQQQLPKIAPLPGGAIGDNLQAKPLRTGAVLLQWWAAAPEAFETRVRRRNLSPTMGEWQELATVRADRFVDRATLLNHTYEYEVETLGQRDDGGGQKARVTVKVARALPPAVLRFHVAARGGSANLRAEWEFAPESRSGKLMLLGQRGEADWTQIAELPAGAEHYEWPAPAEPFSAYRLDHETPGGKREPLASTRLQGNGGKQKSLLAKHFKANPRLFLDRAELDKIKAAAEENPRLKKTYQLALREADIALALLKKGTEPLPRERNKIHEERATQLRQLALAWAFTGNEEYRATAVERLLEYASFYKKLPIKRVYADGRLTHQTLNEAMLSINLAWAYDLLEPSLKEKERKIIADEFLREVAKTLLRTDRGRSNWQTWHNAGLLSIGIALADQPLIDKALHGETGIFWQLHNTLGRDGLYYAQSIAYHHFLMHPFTASAVAATVNGLNLFSDDEDGRALRTMYDVPFYHAFSNGNQAPFGNSQATIVLASPLISWNYAFAYHYFKEADYLWQWRASSGEQRKEDRRMPSLISLWQVLTTKGGPEEASVSPKKIGTAVGPTEAIRSVAGSTLLSDVGMGILRGNTETSGGEAAMIWKPHGKSAGHQHANSLTLYWQSPEHRWISSSGKWVGYTTDLHRDWVMQTLSDNTLLVGRKAHSPLKADSPNWVNDEPGRPTAGELVTFTAGPDFGLVHALNRRVYDHASIARRLINAGSYTVEISHAESAKATTFDHVLHITGHLVRSSASLSPNDQPLGSGHGFGFLEGLQSGTTGGKWETTWSADGSNERLYLTVLTGGNAAAHYALTPWINQKRSTILTTREGHAAGFATVIRSGTGGDPVESITPSSELSSESGSVKVTLQGGAEDHLSWSTTGRSLSIGKVEFRGHDFFLRTAADGRAVGATAVLGERLTIDNQLSLKFEFPATWSWRALEAEGDFLLLYDDDYPVRVQLPAGKEWRVWALDAEGVPVEQLAPVEGSAQSEWLLSPRRNFLFTLRDKPVNPVILTKTINGRPGMKP